MRQAVGDAVVDELVTVESRQAVAGAEPDEAMRIGNDLVNLVACKTFSSGVSANRKLFGAILRDCNQEQYEDSKEGLHGGAIIARFCLALIPASLSILICAFGGSC